MERFQHHQWKKGESKAGKETLIYPFSVESNHINNVVTFISSYKSSTQKEKAHLPKSAFLDEMSIHLQ